MIEFFFFFQKIKEEYASFLESVDIRKNQENISILENVTRFLGIKPSYFFPLNATTRDQITHLSLGNLNIKSIRISFEDFQNLIHLNLSNNQIQEIPSSFSKLAKLQNLDLSNNKISDKIETISNLIHKSKKIELIDLTSKFSPIFYF